MRATPRLNRGVPTVVAHALRLMASLALVPGAAYAAGLDAPNVGSPLSGAVTGDAAATWHNPALLATLRRPQLMLGAGVALAHLGYTRERRGAYQGADRLGLREPVDPAAFDPSLTGVAAPVSSTQVLPVGDAFVAVPVGPRMGVGLGVSVPYAAPVDFDAEGAQRFALQSAFIAVTHLTAAVGVKLHERVQVGAGASLVLGTANLKRIQDFGALDEFGEALDGPPANQPNGFGTDAPSTLRELTVLARPLSLTDAQATNATFHVGLAAQPTDALTLGLSYQHGTELTFEGDFALDMSDDFFTQDLSPVGLAYPRLVEGVGRLKFRLPHRVAAAAAYTVNHRTRLELRLTQVGWSAVESFDIGLNAPGLAQPAFGLSRYARASLQRRWADTYGVAGFAHVRLGGSASAGPDEPARPGPTLSAGLAYETPASPDATIDAASPDGHRLTVRGVADLPLSDRWSVAAHLTLQFIVPRTVTQSDYDLGNGTYSLLVAQAGAHFQYAWGDDAEDRTAAPTGEAADAEPAPSEPPLDSDPTPDDGSTWPELEP